MTGSDTRSPQAQRRVRGAGKWSDRGSKTLPRIGNARLKIRNLSRNFGPVQALNDLSMLVGAGVVVAFGVPEQRNVISLIQQLTAQGRGVIYISHNLQDVFAVADRIAVLRQGVQAGARKISQTTHDEVDLLMVGG